jgi:hypothetical protein
MKANVTIKFVFEFEEEDVLNPETCQAQIEAMIQGSEPFPQNLDIEVEFCGEPKQEQVADRLRKAEQHHVSPKNQY